MFAINSRVWAAIAALTLCIPASTWAFNPQTDVSSGSLVFWLDANDASTLGVGFDDYVDTWDDKSAAANHTDSIDDERPKFVPDAFGPGLNGVRFGSGEDGTPFNDNMLSLNTSPFSGSDFAITTIAVFQLAGPQVTFSSLLGQSPGGSGMSFNVGNRNGGGAFTDHWQPAGWSSTLPVGATEESPLSLSTRKTIVAWSTPQWDLHEENTDIYYDGTKVPGTTYGTGGSTLNPGEFIVGNWSITRNDMVFLGDLAELLVYEGQLTDSDRQSVDQYLGSKWGVTLNPDFGLPEPGGHPITQIDVFDAVDPSIDRNRTGNLQPSLSIDDNYFTWGSPTPSGTADPVIIALGYENDQALATNHFRVKSAAGATGLGGSDIDGVGDNDDFLNLEILWTSDTGPLNLRTYQPVTGMINGINGEELLKAEQVNSDGTIVRTNHAPDTDGEFWSVTFDEVNATALALRVARDESDDAALVHFGAFEYEAFLAILDAPALFGDYNGDGTVDSADFTLWEDTFGGDASSLANRDPSSSGLGGGADFLAWQRSFGSSNSAVSGAAVPEPTAGLLLLAGLAIAGRGRQRRRQQRFQGHR
jgi:hypothetical protein